MRGWLRNKLGHRFDPEIERAYREYRTAQIIPFERLAAVAGTVSVIGLVWWDLQVQASLVSTTLTMRIIIAGVLLLLLGITFTPLGRYHLVLQFLSTVTVIGGFCWILFELPDGYLVGLAGLTLSVALLPLLATTLTTMILLGAVAIWVPNLFLAAAYAPRFTFVNLNTWMVLAVGLAVAFWVVLDMVNRRLFIAERELAAEQERSDQLLKNVLPEEIAERLKRSSESVSARFDAVTILFADVVGFTAFARQREPDVVVDLLNALFSRFDDLVAVHGLEKIKTMGDGYMVAGGVPTPRTDHAAAVATLAIDMVAATEAFRRERGVDWEIRIGVHTGSVVAGVIGKHKFAYDLWGDAVNVASRLESSGVPGRIQISETTAQALGSAFVLETRGAVALKNRGDLATFFVVGHEPQLSPQHS